ncbi:MAG TPA: UDP-N-acetylmuramoyl-tripeptide--D-alanyl-D-alanine ligase [Fibrobacteres bacterium]|jgi:UDP-N-acetylmuramoyl-tripeptide--D-alanyl-D-alanine ligase|nr:UDP-N-acetylmuramoyl-tripeptide--D-alanyl-D-alanine ligase [Fibrobacterota bacterium]
MLSQSKQAPKLTLGNVVEWSNSKSVLPASMLCKSVNGLNNDSRNTSCGEVFVALTTEKDDGHRYAADAIKRGASAAIVSVKKTDMFTDSEKKRLIAVNDPLKALQQIASCYRKTFDIPFIGITGSSGKTTSRSFISHVLKHKLTVGETSGNLNNHIGVPLSILKFKGNENVGVLEMGANHAHEIHLLSTIVKPTIGIITNIGYAHIGYFGSLSNIARAKLEIADGMNDKSGFILLNGDDPLLVKNARGMDKKIIFFGFSSRCRIRAVKEKLISGNSMGFEVDGMQYRLEMPGRHFIYCALAAICLGEYFGIERSLIAGALSSIRPASMRGTIEKKAGATFIVDCYNANPSSMKTAIRLLCDVAGKKKPVAIVGDMLELGKFSKRLHKALGRQLAAAGVRDILAVGEFASSVAEGAIESGMKAKNVRTAKNSDEAAISAKDMVNPGDIALLKGSRGVHLETVFEKF